MQIADVGSASIVLDRTVARFHHHVAGEHASVMAQAQLEMPEITHETIKI